MPELAAEDIERLEAGRRLFTRPWQFIASAPSMAALPPVRGIEVAFAGRSNVGKSSLINALVGQKALARTSQTPGRTQELIFFDADAGLGLVDMPGYGYARVSKQQVADWTKLVFEFLRGRPNLRRVYLLVDSRHGLKDTDVEALDLLDKAAVSVQIVLTKADKMKAAELAKTVEAVGKAIAKRPAAFPEVLATSSESGTGIDVLRARIAALLAPQPGGGVPPVGP